MFCEECPILNYTLKIQSSSEVITHPIVPQQSNFIGNLSENKEYSFKVVVANAVDIVSSNDKQFCEFN